MRLQSPFLSTLLLIPALILSGTACRRGTNAKVWIERWSDASPMNLKRAGLGAVAEGGRIYAIGGGEYRPEGLKIFDSVEFAEVHDDGRPGPWRPASSLNVPRIYHSAAVHDRFIYVLGGEGRTRFYSGAPDEAAPLLLNTVERAEIRPDGTLGEWILEKEKMQTPRRGAELFVYNGWLFAVGGFNGAFLRDAERSKIASDGSLGKWVHEKNLTGRVRYIAGYVQSGDRLYLLGGHLHSAEMAVDTVETARVAPDASLGEWTETSQMATRRFLNGAVRMDTTVYVLGGQNTVALTSTERSEILPDGRLSTWVPDTPLNVARRAAGAVAVGDAVYVLGGMNGPIGRAAPVNSVEFAHRRPGFPLGHWGVPDGPEYADYKKWKSAIATDSEAHLAQAAALSPTDQRNSILFNTAEAIRIDPRNYEAYNIMADAYFRMGKVDRAVKILQRSLEVARNNYDALVELGNIHLSREQFPEAIEYYRKALEAKPDSTVAHAQIGKAHLGLKDYAAAASEFQWILDRHPESSGVRWLLDLAEQRQKTGK